MYNYSQEYQHFIQSFAKSALRMYVVGEERHYPATKDELLLPRHNRKVRPSCYFDLHFEDEHYNHERPRFLVTGHNTFCGLVRGPQV